jgi:hypothetical protein
LELDVQAIEPAKERSSDESKSGLAIDWTTLFIAFIASGGVITTIIGTIQSWLMRNQTSNVTLKMDGDELTITGAGPYSKEQEKAIQLWLNHHKNIMVA